MKIERGFGLARRDCRGSDPVLLLAIKMLDYEECVAPALRRGQLALEGRSIHSTAVYQSLVTA
jgi:hypothetical protein